jgi:hypothetical protein
MNPSRPLAKRRLETALEQTIGASQEESLSLYALKTKLSVLAQEKRFLLFIYMMTQDVARSSQELATAIQDQHSNVTRNLNVLLLERIVVARKDFVTGIPRFTVNRNLLMQFSRFFATSPHQHAWLDEELLALRSQASRPRSIS